MDKSQAGFAAGLRAREESERRRREEMKAKEESERRKRQEVRDRELAKSPHKKKIRVRVEQGWSHSVVSSVSWQ